MMSKINNSYEYYESNQSLLNMLSKKKTGNALINQIISNNENAYQKKMEAMGISSGSSNDKYAKVTKASNSLLDAIENVSKSDLYKAEEGKEYDKSNLIKSVSNFVTAYNNEISNLSTCGGALYNEFASEFNATNSSYKESLEAIGITADKDGKLTIDQDKLSAASVENIQKLFGEGSLYLKALNSSPNSINEILSKVQAMKSSNYNSSGLMI